jgi:site-specific DNA recombinase
LIFQIFGAIAEFERELIKGRTIMGKIASAEMGNYTGSTIPYGYRPVKRKGEKGKRLEIIPKEKKWVEEIYSWYIYEELGFGQIANKLNELQVPRGEHSRARDKYSKWTDKMVHVILTNPLYRGEFVANKRDEDGILLAEKEWTIVEIPPCVSEFTFQQAQNARTGRKGGATDTDYLLSGKLKDMTLESPKHL